MSYRGFPRVAASNRSKGGPPQGETNKRIKLEAPETFVSHASPAIPSSQTSVTGELKQLALAQCKSQESLIGAADVPIHPEMDDEDELPPYHELHEQRNFREKAIALMEHKGMNLSALEPSIEGVLQPFLHRYHAGLNPENDVKHFWKFSFEEYWGDGPPQFLATLMISGISPKDREFKGTEWCCSPRKAQMSAIRVFCEDAEVQAIAEQLPPPYPKISESCKLKKGEKAAVKDAGIKEYKPVEKELQKFLYLRFRALGCRTALWDGNS